MSRIASTGSLWPWAVCATFSPPSGRNQPPPQPRHTWQSTPIITNTGNSQLTATHRQGKMNANGMLSLFTGLERSPSVISRQWLCLASNRCAVFYMPLLIFSRSTLTSLSKDNWQFMTPLFHLMSRRGWVGVYSSSSMARVETHTHTHTPRESSNILRLRPQLHLLFLLHVCQSMRFCIPWMLGISQRIKVQVCKCKFGRFFCLFFTRCVLNFHLKGQMFRLNMPLVKEWHSSRF